MRQLLTWVPRSLTLLVWALFWMAVGPFVATWAVCSIAMAVTKAAWMYCCFPNMSWSDALFLGSISETCNPYSKPFEIMWPLSNINAYDAERHKQLIQLTTGEEIDTNPRPRRRDI